MEIAIDEIVLLINMLLCVFIIVGSFIYFLKIKSQYRWIKLAWSLELLVYLGILIWTLMGGRTTILVQYLFAMLPLSALAYGLVSAFSRKKEAEIVAKLEEKLNGEMEAWVANQLKNMPSKE